MQKIDFDVAAVAAKKLPDYDTLLRDCPEFLPRLREWMETAAAVKGKEAVAKAIHAAFVINNNFRLFKVISHIGEPIAFVAKETFDSTLLLIFATSGADFELVQTVLGFLDKDTDDVLGKLRKEGKL